MHFLIVGAGFSGLQIALQASQCGSVCGTRQSAEALGKLHAAGLEGIVLQGAGVSVTDLDRQIEHNEQLQLQLARTTHLVICTAPDRAQPFNDPVHRLLSAQAIKFPALQWIGYLSTIGVYGNHDGAWVDEKTPCQSAQVRSIMRAQAESAWFALADTWQVPMTCFRLSGIYGTGRNAILDAIAGRARILIKPGQVFNRIHVEDLARASLVAANRQYSGVLNITDDMPAAPQDVVRYAHQLVGKPAPVAVDFSTAEISNMARSFYNENKRVSNALSKQALDFDYHYSSYRKGLDALWAQMSPAES